MDKVDYKKRYKDLYKPSAKKPSIVVVSPLQYAVLAGTGNPETSQAFADAITALYGFSYTISMSYKNDQLSIPNFYPFTVPPLEGVWDTIEGDFDPADKDNLAWIIGIMQPEFVTHDVFARARSVAATKKKNPLINDIELRTFEEGLCCTMLHIGSYDDEPATFARMQAFVEEQGYERIEYTHREIYLSDFRKTAPEKLRTVLRFRIHKKDE